MAVYECMICGHIFDERREETAWDDLPEGWECPFCKASKALFERLDSNEGDGKNK